MASRSDARKPLATILRRLRRSELLGILEYLGRLSVVLGVLSYLMGHGARVEERHHTAWMTINSAANQLGSGGRKEAIEALAKDGVSLAQVNFPNVFLHGLDVHARRSVFSYLNLLGARAARRCDLRGANFSGAILSASKLTSANLRDASLQYASLRAADLQKADLTNAGLRCADLTGADLRGAPGPVHAHLWAQR